MSDAASRDHSDTEAGATGPRLRVSVSAPGAALGRGARRRLTHLLLAKSLAEALLVSALAVGFYHASFTPYLRGSVDVADERSVEGWAVDERRPAARVEVQLYVDGRFVASSLADRPRPDVLAAGRAPDERHGFVFETPALAAGEHEARVYAVGAGGARRTLQTIGSPRRFRAAGPVAAPAGATPDEVRR